MLLIRFAIVSSLLEHGGPNQAPIFRPSLITSTVAFPPPSGVVEALKRQDSDDLVRTPNAKSWLEGTLWDIEDAEEPQERFVSVSVVGAVSHQKSLTDDEMKAARTKTTIGILSTLISYVTLNSWYRTTHPNAFSMYAEDAEEVTWLATSKSWLDKKACRWLSVCGGSHIQLARERYGTHVHHASHESSTGKKGESVWRDTWTEGSHDKHNMDNDTVLREIPDFVLEYAPLVHLFSGEQFWPCDIAEHLYHITPHLNYTPIQSEYQHPKLKNLDDLNQWEPNWVYLTSNDDVEERPEWLEGAKNIPSIPTDKIGDFTDNDGWVHHPGRTYLQGLKDAAGDLKDWYGGGDHTWDNDDSYVESDTAEEAHKKHMEEATRYLHEELKRQSTHEEEQPTKTRGGRSDAPAVLIAVDKGHGIVDAFWFFFYSFNLGNSVFNVRFGNHVGDWEHTAVRFHHGKPKAVFFSEHNFGSAYGYEAVEKLGKRPVIYSATGTHAMYATAGLHPYVLPWGILHDETDKGPLWDPVLNAHAYTYDHKTDILRASTMTPKAPIGWFHYAGHWGDKYYPLGDKRQYRFAGQYHYVNGPLGPKFKNLGRKKICGGPDSAPCVIKHWIGESVRVKRWQNNGEEADSFSAAAKV